MNNLPLINKYRPADWSEVVGHESLIKGLQRALTGDAHPHAFLFTGPSGTGKTTLSRIVAKHVGAEVTEIDAATHNSTDAMRNIVETGSHMSLTGAGKRLFILNEVQRLATRGAWDVLLTTLEEPPAHLYFALTTTEPERVPDAVMTRCYHVALRRLKPNEIEDLLLIVADEEGWDVHPDVFQAVIQASDGQPRKALTTLQSVYAAESIEEVKRIISLIDVGEPLIELCKYLLSGKKEWSYIQRQLAKIDDEDFATASAVAARYIASVFPKAETDNQARMIWGLINALTFPTQTYEPKLAFYTAIGRILWE